MYLYKAKMPQLNQNRVYKRNEPEVENCLFIPEDFINSIEACELKEFSVLTRVQNVYIDRDKLANDYGADSARQFSWGPEFGGFFLHKKAKHTVSATDENGENVSGKKAKQTVLKKYRPEDGVSVSDFSLKGDKFIVEVLFRSDPETIKIPNNDIRDKYSYSQIDNMYAVEMTEVNYWRKNYKLQDAFYNELGFVENTGYHKVNSDFIERQNLLPDGEEYSLLDGEAFFYYEWY